jgi:uncharacterized membrane protein YvlD (DUF360 family)
MASWFVPGFHVRGLLTAFLAAVILAVVQLLFKQGKSAA